MTHIKPGTSGEAVSTTCCYCGVGCGILVSKDRQGRISVTGDPAHPVNKGMLCSKGMNLHYTVNEKSDRLLFPTMRMNRYQEKQRVSWDEAMDRTVAVFKTLIEKYGPDSVAFYASGQCLTEEYYVINKLVKGFLKTNNLDTNSRLCMSSAVVAYKMSLGEDIVPLSYDDIEMADCIFVAGANPAWCHPVLWRRIESAKEKNPSLKIIVSDPRKTQTCSIADLHLQLNPGTDITLHFAISRTLIEEDKVDATFIKEHTEGFETFRAVVFEKTIEEAAVICGVSPSDIRTAAHLIGASEKFVSMWTMGLNQSVVGVQKNLSLINLHLITGQIGKPGAGPFSLTGQPNAMGGRETGGMANLLPAHRDLSNPIHRAEVEQFWKIEPGTINAKPGYSATEIFEELNNGKLKAVWIIGTNPCVSMPDAKLVDSALKKAKFVVVQDISANAETIPYADVVFPAATWAEKEGTMTNAERRISYLHKITDAPGEALPDSTIICRFARKMGFHGFDFEGPAEIYSEHVALTKNSHIDISELNYEILKKQKTIQWPYSAGSSSAENAKRIFTDRKFYTSSGRAVIHSFSDSNTSETTSPDFPLILTTGRIRDQWHTMTRSGKVNKLKQHISESYLEIHPEDAGARGLADGELAIVSSSNGAIRLKTKWSEDIKPGVVFIPMHWGKILGSDLNQTNRLTVNRVDPLSKEPDFKFTAVQVSSYKKQNQKIIVIGAGAGACGFVKSYRELNLTDQIEIFSKEDYPFYNRVLLPDYITGQLQWKNLVKMTDEDEYHHSIRLHRGVSIEKIDRESKTVIDSRGQVHSYDQLIISTGSRPALLKDIPSMDGIFTMRSRADADAFGCFVKANGDKVIIVGGGLLGIELAASLRGQNFEVVIIQRISRLMDRQLDPLGSQLLHEELTDKGIEIFYNDEIDRFLGSQQISGIRLKSGLMINCQAVVIAIGTVPNTELARNAGLECKRGVVVNEYLQTSDPSIFAIGEIAEFNGFLYGITAAAEQQAAIVASYISGDIAKYYSGSLLMNILKMHGTQLCSLGTVEYPDEPGYEEVVFIDKAKRYYKKCIIYNDRLIGAILIGDKTEFLEFRNLIEKKIELSEKRLQLLRSGRPAEPLIGKLVCSCNNVGEGNLVIKIKEGCVDHLQLCQLTGAGQGCGSCRPEVKKILEENLAPGTRAVAV
ncbi:molybdopterin-dependent oxidoreductase [Pollutibacter soli]|uniref:molybdopterin-dependent oxidoreductase n=1 Tax=Pollutibacter soli TaxID=3034157 RepID=UPI0030135D24